MLAKELASWLSKISNWNTEKLYHVCPQLHQVSSTLTTGVPTGSHKNGSTSITRYQFGDFTQRQHFSKFKAFFKKHLFSIYEFYY